jgi:aminopeptidase N
MTMHRRVLCLFVSAFVVSACGSKPKVAEESTAPAVKEVSDLSWDLAKSRKSRLQNVQYSLDISLNETDLSFRGSEKINFELKDAKSPLRLDFLEGTVTALRLNGKDVPTTAQKEFGIDLPAEGLKVGANQVELTYTAPYSRQGTGLHRFQDPETKEIFLYSHFEPFDAHRLFPCFDQPDMRAVLTLKVQAPAAWQVISTTLETDVQTPAADTKLWTFAPTPALATYLFSLHAGPYKVWKDQYEDIPLRLFARPSLAKYVQAAEWMALTKQGLKFYNEYFAYRYPFQKYDQILVPEANSGAMENVGAVTFNERYVKRSVRTREEKRKHANTLLHEMAHMWFGDLVTMSWWNDLWLNESFATYMAALAQEKATEYQETWQSFFANQKTWGYWEDSLITTHPIEAPVPSVRQAFANFDGITYGKGAAVLQQLRAYIGEVPFREGIQDYIKTHALGNTQRQDFTAALQRHTPKDLNAWSQAWLQQSGTDDLAVSWSCEGKLLKKLTVNLTPKDGANFRPQTLELGLKTASKSPKAALEPVNVDLEAPVTEIPGSWSCPQFVYPNSHDYGYANVILDPVSLKFAQQHLSEFPDPHLRNQLWNDLWQMVRNGKMPLKDYVKIVNLQFPKERDPMTLELIRNTISAPRERGSLLELWPRSTAKSQKDYAAFIAKTEAGYLQRFKSAKRGSDDQKFWFDSYVSLARTPKALAQLKAWMRPKAKIAAGFVLDPDRQWDVLHQLVRFDAKGNWAAKAAELRKQDPSDRALRQALGTEVLPATLANKEKWYGSLTQNPLALSLWESQTVMGSLFPLEQMALAKNFDAAFYNYLTTNAQGENDTYLRAFAGTLTPLSCESARSDKLQEFLAQQALSPAVSKTLRVRLQEDQRCQGIRTRSGM